MVRGGLNGFLVAFVLAAASLGGAALHLCTIEGAVGASCCCHESGSEQPPLQVKRPDDCCGAMVPRGDAPQALTSHGITVELTPLLAGVAALPKIPTSLDADTRFTRSARGPPLSLGSQLFIQHCSFLI